VNARLLAVYLNDHLAGATAVVELARRAAREHEGEELGFFLAQLAAEIGDDRRALRRVMAAAGVRPDLAKIAAGWVAEKVARLELGGRPVCRSALSPLLELEAIAVGVHGKLLLWRVLRDRRPEGASAVDLDALIARAERQLDAVERHRREAGAVLSAAACRPSPRSPRR
jgi:hypothetical protein